MECLHLLSYRVELFFVLPECFLNVEKRQTPFQFQSPLTVLRDALVPVDHLSTVHSINWCLVAPHGFYWVIQNLLFLVSFLHIVLEIEWVAWSPRQNSERRELFNGPLQQESVLKSKPMKYQVSSLLLLSKTRSRQWDNDLFQTVTAGHMTLTMKLT